MVDAAFDIWQWNRLDQSERFLGLLCAHTSAKQQDTNRGIRANQKAMPHLNYLPKRAAPVAKNEFLWLRLEYHDARLLLVAGGSRNI
jgi:hypothetical protein